MSFPTLSKKKINKLIDDFYNAFFNIVIEILSSISMTQKEIMQKVVIRNVDLIEKSIHKKKPIILISSHYSNWEWAFLRISLIKNINLNAVYKPISNHFFNDILLKIRTKFNAQLIPLEKWIFFILKNKNKNKTFMFIADQVPSNAKHGKRINFLNQSTLFHEGPEKIAKILNADVFYVDVFQEEKGEYTLEFEQILSKNITQQYAQILEKRINNNPKNWLWSHNRWKR
tara:strand:- start:7578 stop:8264 length:687 start_codon:yes stop_codon:yes gene_type:complete